MAAEGEYHVAAGMAIPSFKQSWASDLGRPVDTAPSSSSLGFNHSFPEPLGPALRSTRYVVQGPGT